VGGVGGFGHFCCLEGGGGGAGVCGRDLGEAMGCEGFGRAGHRFGAE